MKFTLQSQEFQILLNISQDKYIETPHEYVHTNNIRVTYEYIRVKHGYIQLHTNAFSQILR